MKPYFSTLTDLYNYASSRYARRTASEYADGTMRYSYSQFKDCCDNISRILSNFGIGATDKVAILSENKPNWSVAFFAITAFGRIAVPMLPDLSHDEVENILAHSEAKAIFISKKQLAKLSKETVERLNLVIDIDDFTFVKATGESYTCDGKVSVPTPLDIAAILYTSGTTGNAKGVMLSHRNFCVNVMSSWYSFRISKKDVFLSILPMAHTYELSIGMLYPFAMGARVAYLQKVPTPSILLATLKQIRPTAMLSVPLIIEKIYKSSVIPAINGSKFLQFLQKDMAWLLYMLIGIKLRKTFGGRLKFFGIGGAKLDTTVEAFLKKTGFPYAIGYGLTETAPLICAAPPRKTAVGSTGRAVPGIQVRLNDINPETGEGEITVKGPNVMQGYLNDPVQTARVLDHGWYDTGDIARMDIDGYITIRGRLSRFSKIAGEMVPHEMLECIMNELSGSEERCIAVTGIPDPVKGEALVVLHTRDLKRTPEEMNSLLRERSIPNLWIPRPQNYWLVDHLPILASGKLDLLHLSEFVAEIQKKHSSSGKF